MTSLVRANRMGFVIAVPPNGLELSCPAEAGNSLLILAHNGGPGAQTYPPARRVSFSELLGGSKIWKRLGNTPDLAS